MTDNLSKEVRSRTMRAVKQKHTRIEDFVISALWHRGFRFRRNVYSLLGTPDIAIKKYKIVIFIDSCYWHGCNQHSRMPKSNRRYWQRKIEKNRARDIRTNAHYRKMHWHIARIWEHELKKDANKVIDKAAKFIEKFSTPVRTRKND